MISPYVRRQRLAAELYDLREVAGLTHAQLAKRIDQPRTKITRLENGHTIRDGQAVVMQIIDELGVDEDRWTEIMAVARDSAERGWWSGYGKAMGTRQALYADLEAGASTIREFQPFIPGLLQTAAFARHKQIAGAPDPVESPSQRAAEARQTRQRMLRRPDGPSYEVVLDEVALRRLPAPPTVMVPQVQYLAEAAADEKVTVRVLPVDVTITGYENPRVPFSLYTYPDPADPQVAAVDTVTIDLVLTSLRDQEQLDRYDDLYARIHEAALDPDASVEFLGRIAAGLGAEQGATA